MMQVIKHKVIIFSPALNAVSGVATHVNMLLNSRLTELYDFRHFQVGREGHAENGVQRLIRFVLSPFQLAIVLFKVKPKIVHINTSMNRKAFWRDLTLLVVAKLAGRKVVNQFHSGSAPISLFSNPLLLFLMRRFLLASDVVTVLSSEALVFHRAFDSRIAVELVPNAIDTNGLLNVTRCIHQAAPLLRLVYVGRIVRSKGLFDALEALHILKSGGLQFHMKVAGSGPDEALVRESILRLGLIHEVTLLGPIFGDAKSQLWLESDVQVFPTYHNEGLPYSILESMAAGCVPVTCRVAAIPDVMADGVHGLFVPAHDPQAVATAVRRLANDRQELSKMSRAGRTRIEEQYTVDRLAERLDEIYRRLVA